MIDYSIFYRDLIDPDRIKEEIPQVDVFVSAYNASDRVKLVFNQIEATTKVWVVHPEYQYEPIEYPDNGTIVCPNSTNEVRQVDSLLSVLPPPVGMSICIDITGFMRNTLAFLIAKLKHMGVTKILTLYSEPMYYVNQDLTTFSTSTTGFPRPIKGMAGSSSSAGSDALLLGVGYDHELMGQVVDHKENATVHPIFSFPSLSPDMYQQSAIRSSNSGAIVQDKSWRLNRRYAPANDPFSTAQVVSQTVFDIDQSGHHSNIYLSPLSTKVQTLGFALYWLLEGRHRRCVTLLMPECLTYSRETTRGLKRLWLYTLEL